MSIFGNTTNSIHNPFAVNITGNASTPVFGSTNNSSYNPFSSNTSGNASVSSFGDTAKSTQSPFAFNTTGSASMSVFGNSNNSTPYPFGANTSGNVSTPVFGSTSNSTHNPFAPNTNAIAFGNTTNSTTNPFGVNTSGNVSTPVFGSTSNTTQNPFAPNTNANAFGNTTNSTQNPFAFNTTGTASMSAFGNSNNLTPNPFGFSTTSNASTPVFGSSSNSAHSLFAPSNASTSIFGSSNNSTYSPFAGNTSGNASVSIFGSTNNSTPNSFGVSTIGNTTSPSSGFQRISFDGTSTGNFGIKTSSFNTQWPSGTNTSFTNAGPSTFGFNTTSSQSNTNSGSNLPFSFVTATATAPTGNISQPAGVIKDTRNDGFGFGPFGSTFASSSQPTGSILGVQAPSTQSKGSRIKPYEVTKDDVFKLFSISSMPVYESKCHEELRWEDYELKSTGTSGTQNPFNPISTVFGPTAPFNPTFPRTSPPFNQPSLQNPVSISPTSSWNSISPGTATPGFNHPSSPLPTTPFPSPTPSNLFPSSTISPTFPNTSLPSLTPSLNFPSSNQNHISVNPVPPSTSTPSPTIPQTPNSYWPGFSGTGASQAISPTFPNTSLPSLTPSLNFPSSNQNHISVNPVPPSTSTPSPTIPQTPNSYWPGFSGTGASQAISPTFPNTSLPSLTPSLNFPSSNQNHISVNPVPPSTSTPSPTIPQTPNSYWPGFSGTGVSQRNQQAPSSWTALTPTAAKVADIIAVKDPFGTQSLTSHSSVGHPIYSPSARSGISSMPVIDKPVTKSISSLVTARHIPRRPVTVQVRKYHPKSDVPKVPFFDDTDERRNPLKERTSIIPRENPRSVFGVTSKPSGVSNVKEESSFLHDDGGLKPKKDQDSSPISCNKEHDRSADEKCVRVNPSPPKLHRSDYYTQPSIHELTAAETSNPGFCTHVKDFTVGRHGYGWVKFEGETDVRGLDLDAIVSFNKLEVVVYEDEKNKPEVGEGLNKASEVTLLNAKCCDKTGNEYNNVKMVVKFAEKLKQAAENQGAEFVSYDAVNGIWKFRVKHF